MVHVTGTVHDVSDNPDRVERIIVRAAEPRMHGTTYITEESAQFPVVDGVLDFEVLPGPCVVAFLRHHGATTYEKLLVPDTAEATFKECLDAGNLAEEGDRSALEKVVRQIQDELAKAAPLVEEVRTLRTEVSNDRTAVDGFAKAAQKSASDAATSQSKAKTSETNAANSAASAKSQQESAKTHFNNTVKEAEKAASSAAAAKTSETNAASHKKAAATSATKAATHETNAGASATAAASSAAEAKGHADRAEVASDPEGLRNEMTKQFAALVDGAPEDLDTIREIAEYAQANRDVTDQLNAAIGNKANKSHTHAQSEITGLATALSGKAAKSHTHTTSQVTGLDTALNDKADKTHTHASADITDTTSELMSINPNRVVRTNGDGSISIHNHTITGNYSAANKAYVDGEVAKKANTSHTHAQSDITGLSTALSGKANSSHKHTTADITDFATEMGKKANTSHTHTQAQVTGLSTALSGKADKSHKHTTADITDFATEMGKKANTSHTHTTSQISGLGTALNGKADKTYVNARPALFSGSGAPPSSITGAVAGDFWLNTTTMELHKITGV